MNKIIIFGFHKKFVTSSSDISIDKFFFINISRIHFLDFSFLVFSGRYSDVTQRAASTTQLISEYYNLYDSGSHSSNFAHSQFKGWFSKTNVLIPNVQIFQKTFQKNSIILV